VTLNPLLSLGLLFLLGLFFSNFIKKIKLPAVTAYLLLGIIIGPSFLNLVSEELLNATPLIANVVLSFIAFSIGRNFSKSRLSDIGKPIVVISLLQSFGAAIAVFLALFYLGNQSFFNAITFAAIAPATAPAAVVMVVRETRAKGKFTDTLLGIVAMDDVWGLMIFAIVLATIKSITGVSGSVFAIASQGIANGVIEIFGAVVLGILLGWLLSYFSKLITNPSELLIYTIGFILFNTGVSLFLGVSVLLSNMTMASAVINSGKSAFRYFESLRTIDSPFYLLFFVVAGANLEITALRVMGAAGLVYIIARMAGKVIGTYFGAVYAGGSREIKRYLGMGLAPQAGVTLGMAMIIKGIFPLTGGFILSVIVATTVVYELFGPMLTKYSLVKAKNIE